MSVVQSATECKQVELSFISELFKLLLFEQQRIWNISSYECPFVRATISKSWISWEWMWDWLGVRTEDGMALNRKQFSKWETLELTPKTMLKCGHHYR